MGKEQFIFNRIGVDKIVPSEEITQAALGIRDILIQHPGTITSFVRTANDYIAHYRYEENPIALQRVNQLLDQVDSFLHTHHWENEIGKELSMDDRKELLRSLPQPKDKFSRIETITNTLARGFVATRFEKTLEEDPYAFAREHTKSSKVKRMVNQRGWRGAIIFLKQLADSALESDPPDLVLTRKWFDLIMGNNEDILRKRSLPYRAFFDAVRVANPEDEDILELSGELGFCTSTLAVVFGRLDEWRINSQYYTDTVVPMLNAAFIKYSQTKSQLKTSDSIPADIAEIARHAVTNDQRYSLISQNISKDYNRTQLDSPVLSNSVILHNTLLETSGRKPEGGSFFQNPLLQE